MTTRLAILAAALLLVPDGLWGGDLSGIWYGEVAGRRGPQDISFQFVQEGGRLSGKLYQDQGSSPIVDGSVDGDGFTFLVVAREQAGNQINLVSYQYVGRVLEDQLEVTRERVGAVDAVSGAEYVIRTRPEDEGKPPPKIVLLRLL